MNWDLNNKQEFEVICHTDLGDKNDEHGRFFEKGKKYKMSTEPKVSSKDTNYKPAILCWVSFNKGFGARFAIIGNIYHLSQDGYWDHFTDIFYDPFVIERDEKLKSIGI